MSQSSSTSKNESVIIAQGKSIENWNTECKKLEGDTSPETWERIFKEYFVGRLKTRYLDPLRVIDQMHLWQGEGFSIVAVQCSLIEFLQSTWEGKNYKFRNPGKDEYNKSSVVFQTFLTTHAPFNRFFDAYLAQDFYENVRCPVLHEARTSGGWIIHAASSVNKLIDVSDPTKKILYRNDFTAGLWQFIERYGERLKHDTTLQKAFKQKFDALAKS